jgi:hypothetical protein
LCFLRFRRSFWSSGIRDQTKAVKEGYRLRMKTKKGRPEAVPV